MANKNSNRISIKPINNAAAIASTLGISEVSAPEIEPFNRENINTNDKPQIAIDAEQLAEKSQTESIRRGNETQITSDEAPVLQNNRETSVANSKVVPQENQAITKSEETALDPPEMPLLIEIKRKFPGKELFILSLLYLQRNNRGLVQMTVSSMMALYTSVFQDVIKDDTARRSLKRLFDAGYIKTTSIPGNNSGYIYEINDLLETENLSAIEKEEFSDLTKFVKSRLNSMNNV